MITQIVRPFIAWSMFILENNVRSAVSLGIIGAGGLGVTLSIFFKERIPAFTPLSEIFDF
ncbi:MULTISPECIES: hypothetical protein [Haloferacaceae]|jgi:phosphonate transport system permease protein|uniref:Phosphonate transport system permease protein n=1 Tax=Halohasta litchfieldiae TaxID=1073996 RepID=A0A1H6VMH1_9EURY|nr:MULTISPECIES: hypothetical protein [Halorubraceae]SEJ04244.1 phosphonate transport system permease protein [Halohasta litchfieldiae]